MSVPKLEPGSGAQSRPAQTPPAFYRAIVLLLGAIAVGVATVTGWFWIYSSLTAYDDEGFVLLSLRQVLRGGVLYEQVYSQYGPAYYALQISTLRLLGQPVTHDVLRAVTLAHWVLASVLGACAVWRIGRSPVGGIAAFMGAFISLRICGWEPTHPQALSAVCLTGSIFAGTFVSPGRGGRVAAFVMGALGAALLLVKVNLGIFLLVAAGLAGFRAARPSGLLRVGFGLSAVAAAAMPVVLMRGMLAEQWVVVLCALALVTIGMTVYACSRSEPVTAWDRGTTFAGIAGFLGMAVAVTAWTLAQGTTPAGFLRGVLLQHLGFEKIFLYPALIRPKPLFAFAIPAVSLFVAYHVLLRLPGGRTEKGAGAILLTGKLWFGLLVLGMVLLEGANAAFTRHLYLPLAAYCWLGAVAPPALHPDTPPIRFGRLLLSAAAATELLWTYPVAGFQVSCALLLPACVAALCLSDAVRTIAAKLPAAGPRIEAFSGIVVGAAAVWHTLTCFGAARAGYESSAPLDLPGARMVRAEPKSSATLRRLVAELRRNEGTFFCSPGFNSLYFWAEKEPPTDLNAGAWMILLNDKQQHQVVRELSSQDGLVLVYNADRERFWLRTGLDIDEKPLVAYLRREFAPYGNVDDFVLARRRRQSVEDPRWK